MRFFSAVLLRHKYTNTILFRLLVFCGGSLSAVDMTEDQQNVPHADEVTSKYKRLLSLAKSNLESNQSLMAEKDKQISQLKQQMEEMKSSKFGNRRPSTMPSDDGQAAVPRQILRNIAVNGKIWVLLEFSGLSGGDSWKLFNNEQELDDFISRQSGPPLIKPHLCLTVEESTRIMEEAKRKLDTVVEEFRRYKVRTEVLRKQKEGEKVVNTNNLFPGLGGFGINRTSPGRGSLLSAEFDNMGKLDSSIMYERFNYLIVNV